MTQFKAFPKLTIPDFLNTPDWTDESWGNDVTAKVSRVLPSDSPYELTVWVHPKKKVERESPDYERFAVSVYDKSTGDELESEGANTEKACISIINVMLWKINLITNNRIENDKTS